ncbi:cobaltochelatase subunit CobN [Fodinicurvata sp. EGI_FJ10296]|uniref:cobaltochelatase subunit CobN n=1 Tax=Fodinicurvata sp. EGI_FJ10296 TaxID=3231908 RepID=UPI0034529BBB
MHLLNAAAGAVSDGSDPVDLGQDPGDIVVITSADTEITCIARACAELAEGAADAAPSVRLANYMALGHNMSVDMYLDRVIAESRYVIVRLLGGVPYWRYGIEQLNAVCRDAGIPLAVVPGTVSEDPELDALCTVPKDDARRIWDYFREGGIDNARRMLSFAQARLSGSDDWQDAAPLAPAGPHPIADSVTADLPDDAPRVALTFYRALVQAGTTEPIDALAASLAERGLRPMAFFVSSLKDPKSKKVLQAAFDANPPDVVINATSFAGGDAGADWTPGILDDGKRPVIQVALAAAGEADWRENDRGLSPKDLAMWVALPEVDGRIVGPAVAFKDRSTQDPLTQTMLTRFQVVPDRIDRAADMALAWTRLGRTPRHDRTLAIVMANYPGRPGRVANAVGLDTPESTLAVLSALKSAGYEAETPWPDGGAMMADLETGAAGLTDGEAFLPVAIHTALLAALPDGMKAAVEDRWGLPESDPNFDAERGGFPINARRCGQVWVGLQPKRNHQVDVSEDYHSPDLVPPHAYIAFYLWLRHRAAVQAIVQMGKHGTLEWLPGKALAMSDTCWPDALGGPMPTLYPFIVNDPGEGTQAKRRLGAVILDHLTPPLTRADNYGPVRDLERLVDEYYDAAGLDQRRLEILRRDILDVVRANGLDHECGITPSDDDDTMLGKIDAHLCDLKELQIRDGLHTLGLPPTGEARTSLILALARMPGRDGRESLTGALAADLALTWPTEDDDTAPFDPLTAEPSAPWTGPQPAILADAAPDAPWRLAADTIERLETVAAGLIDGTHPLPADWPRTAAALDAVSTTLIPALDGGAADEIGHLLAALDGGFVPPGRSGAPTRGRADVLPTGRNFFSVDTRTIPTPTAWTLGWASADALVTRYRQDHGGWPKGMVITVWGTASMRTGGDDLAQAMALIGVQPVWDTASRRLTGFEIIPASVLDRPRVDVTLRISGFFRDAFPYQIDLFDSAVRAVAALDEPDKTNPIAAAVRRDRAALADDGAEAAEADKRAGFRVFGAAPGVYGTGLQDRVDQGDWTDRADLAQTFLDWSGYAYGSGAEGTHDTQGFARRLTETDAVVQNRDSDEQDILDGNDYYQFQGGALSAIAGLTGREVQAYTPDHGRPGKPVIRSLEQEIARTVRARAANPKWIAGMMRHGYKGAQELAATVDNLFGFAATSRAVEDRHFEMLAEAYLDDPEVRDFLERSNPAAGADIADRLAEALGRGLWQPRSNTWHDKLAALSARWRGRTATNDIQAREEMEP